MKAEFSNLEALRNWLVDVANPVKYDLYYETIDRRVYAIKNVSTEPRIHGFVENVDIADVDAMSSDISRPLTTVKTWEWEHDTTDRRT